MPWRCRRRIVAGRSRRRGSARPRPACRSGCRPSPPPGRGAAPGSRQAIITVQLRVPATWTVLTVQPASDAGRLPAPGPAAWAACCHAAADDVPRSAYPATWDASRSRLPSCPSRRLAPGLLPGGEERLPGLGQREDRLGCCLVPGLPNVRVCGQDLQLIRADRIISLPVPFAAGYGAAAPDDRTPQVSARASRQEPALTPARGEAG